MRVRSVVFVLLLWLCVPALLAQADSAGGSEGATAGETVETSDSRGDVAPSTPVAPVPGWVHVVRLAALAGPIAFLAAAWLAGGIVHYRLVRREHDLFPAVRGTRIPQTMPMLISAALFFVPVALFVFFEIRSRWEIARHIGGVVDQWHPVTARAWMTLFGCLVLAITPWLFARRADSVR
ncbi:MAG TPA: hypothetical protein VJ276_25510 [Thermoanaerobaculia bacterium]|nr:hypothetical protein [Thermoanaerobaculia bacterium]